VILYDPEPSLTLPRPSAVPIGEMRDQVRLAISTFEPLGLVEEAALDTSSGNASKWSMTGVRDPYRKQRLLDLVACLSDPDQPLQSVFSGPREVSRRPASFTVSSSLAYPAAPKTRCCPLTAGSSSRRRFCRTKATASRRE
jgi:hypothetical protein